MILYFSGTGNSRYVAERIAKALGDELFSMNDRIKAGNHSPVETNERLIIVTPLMRGAFRALYGIGW